MDATTRIKLRPIAAPDTSYLDRLPDEIKATLERASHTTAMHRLEVLGEMYKLTMTQLRQQQNEILKYYERHGHLFVEVDGQLLKGPEGMPIPLELPLSRPQQLTGLRMLFELYVEVKAEALAKLKEQRDSEAKAETYDFRNDPIFDEGDGC